jgi:hypothetical protein
VQKYNLKKGILHLRSKTIVKNKSAEKQQIKLFLNFNLKVN